MRRSKLLFAVAGLISICLCAATADAAPPPVPAGLTITNVTRSGLSASWSGTSAEFRAIYKAGSLPASPTDGTLITEGTSTSASVSGLAPNQRYFIAVYGKLSGSATYSASADSTSIITLMGQSIDATSTAGSGRTSDTNQGQLLFVDDPGVTDVLELFNGSSVVTVEAKGTGQNVDFDDFGLGSGATPGHVIAVWRRDQDSGHLSVDGGTPVLISGVNPFNAAQAMNLEGLGIADGCVFAVLQSFTATAQAVKNVYVVDAASGNAGSSLTGTAAVPGVTGRVRTSACKAVWAFNVGTAATPSLDLQYYNGSSVQTLDSGIGSQFLGATPSIAQGRIVYVKPVGGVDQVFLYDTNAATPAPVQITNYTDATKFLDAPQTDGRHVAWFRNNNTNTAPEIDLGTGLQFAAGVGKLTTEPEFELNRGQLLWIDSSGTFRYDSASGSSFLTLPGTTNRPWLTDGFIGFGDSVTAGAFLHTGTAPNDSQQPAAPLVVQATAGTNSITVAWDAILGATSYNLYYANQPGVTKASYSTLLGGTRIAAISGSSITLPVSSNVPYYFVVTTTDPTGEGPESRQASEVVIGSPAWTSVGGLSSTTMNVAAADRTNANVAYTSGGTNTYETVDGGFTWNPLAGGIAGASVHAIVADSGRVFATTPTGSIYESTTGGATWAPILSASGVGEQVQSIAIDPAVGTTILAGDFQLSTFRGGLNDSYLIRSDDGGATWFHTPQPAVTGASLSAYTIAIDPTRTPTFYAGGTGTPNVAKSIVGGAGWSDASVPASGSGAGYIYTLAVDPTDPLIVYAGVQTSFGSGTTGVYKSTNGGGTWTAINSGLTGPPAVHSLVIDPVDHNILHLGTETGYDFSIDGGLTWTANNAGLGTAASQFIESLALTQSHRLIAATQAGLYLLNLHAPTAPGAPAITQATPGNGKATFAFTAPSSDGGSPITSYTVTCNPGGFNASGPASPIVVGGLMNGVQYSCSATATNGVGTGPASNSVMVTPAGGVVYGDFNGDGKADLMWHNGSTGDNSVWLMNGPAVAASAALPTVAATNWQVAGIGDFNGDGFADVLWHNTATGDNSIWFMSGPNVAVSGTIPSVPDTNWKIAGIGDFNGDGKADILWHNAVTGNNSLWLMNGPNVAVSAALPTVADTNWKIAGIGDFNGDGKADILWHNTSTGDNSLWLMSGINIALSASLPTVSNTAWQIAGVGDLNGDGMSDIVWRNATTGDNSVWFMSGIYVAVSGSLPTVADTNWKIARVADFQGDGKADLMWHHSVTGSNSVWLMNGINVAAGAALPTIPDTNWNVAGPP